MTDAIETEIGARNLRLTGTRMMIRIGLWLSIIGMMAKRRMCRWLNEK